MGEMTCRGWSEKPLGALRVIYAVVDERIEGEGKQIRYKLSKEATVCMNK